MSSPNAQNIVIVGGGYAGIFTWKLLSTQLDVKTHNLVLVTPQPYLMLIPPSLRMVVTAEGKLEDSVFLPLSDEKYNTGNKKLIIASVTSIVEQENQGGYLILDNGDKVEYSILILTTGTLWEGPLALPHTKAEAVEVITSWRSRFAEAKDIVLVGGGANGLEFAGEIKDLGSDKNVTIVHGSPLLLNDAYPQSWRTYIAKQFGARGVKLVLGDYVDDVNIKEGSITTRGGKQISADLVVPTRGGRPNTKFIESLGDVLTESGTVKVSPTLQVAGHPRIFAGGDIIEWKEQKQVAKTPNHAVVLALNALVLLGLTNKTLSTYEGSTEQIILTNGKNGGTGYFGILWGITIGNRLSARLKSRTLFVDLAKKRLGFA